MQEPLRLIPGDETTELQVNPVSNHSEPTAIAALIELRKRLAGKLKFPNHIRFSYSPFAVADAEHKERLQRY
jgi:hypothetical protein